LTLFNFVLFYFSLGFVCVLKYIYLGLCQSKYVSLRRHPIGRVKNYFPWVDVGYRNGHGQFGLLLRVPHNHQSNKDDTPLYYIYVDLIQNIKDLLANRNISLIIFLEREINVQTSLRNSKLPLMLT